MFNSVTPWITAHQVSLSFTVSQSLLKLMFIELVMPSNHLILCNPFSCPQSFPVSGSFAISQLFASGGQSIGVSVSASVLQGWFPLELTGLISLLSKGLSKVFSSTTVQKHQFLAFHKDSQVPCIPFENYWSCPTDLFCSWRTKRLKRCHLPKEKLIISHFAWF